MPKINLFKISVAVTAAAVGAVLAITSVFAHSAPATSGHSIVGSIVKAEVAASFPMFTADAAPNTITDEQTTDADEAAEIAAEQAEVAAKQAAQAAEKAKEQAAAAEGQQGETTDNQQEGDVEDQAGNDNQGGD